MRSSESQHFEIQTEEWEADGSRRLLFSLQCTRSATGREQSGNNRPGSCSHQQTVYCKKVAGSKAKHQPETQSMRSKIQYLLRKPGTWKTEVRNSHSVLSERARARINLSSSAQLASCSPAIYCCLRKSPGRHSTSVSANPMLQWLLSCSLSRLRGLGSLCTVPKQARQLALQCV